MSAVGIALKIAPTARKALTIRAKSAVTNTKKPK